MNDDHAKNSVPGSAPPGGDPDKAGLVAIVGRANVGKSTLLNGILKEKVSIVSPVAQTTRNLIRAILTEPRGQLVFLDTPGVHQAAYELGRVMNRLARAATAAVDVVLLVLDGSAPPRAEDEGWMKKIIAENLPCVIVLNKSDRRAWHEAEYRRLWETARAAARAAAAGAVAGPEPEWRKTAAVNGRGLRALVDCLFAMVPAGPRLFPDNVLTDYPRKLSIADVIREKLFHLLAEELPHAVAVHVESLDESGAEWLVNATIYVNKSSQKPIVIGSRGRRLRSVKRAAEQELAEMFGRPVRLDLWVKVEKDWARNFWMLKKFGYVE